MRDHSESVERFLSTFAVASLEYFIRVKYARLELRVYRGRYGRDKSLGAPSKVAAMDLHAVFDGDLEVSCWALADLESIPGGTVAGRARKIDVSFRYMKQAPLVAGGGVPKNLLE